MAEHATAAPKDITADAGVKDTEKSPENPGRRMQAEVKNVANTLFRRRINKDQPSIDADPVARKINWSLKYGNLTTEEIGGGIDFPGPDGKTSKGAEMGNAVHIMANGERGRLVQIMGGDKDNLTISYHPIDDAGKEDTDILTETNVPRQHIIEANLLSEREEILSGLSEDERAVAETYFNLIDPTAGKPPEYNNTLRSQVERVAEQNALPTAAWFMETAMALQGDKLSEEVTVLLSEFDAANKTVLDRDDLENALQILGVDGGWMDRQADALLGQLTDETKKLDAAKAIKADTTIFQQRVDDINAHLALVTTTNKLWKEAEAKGSSPIESFLDKAVNGELDPGFLQELKSGSLNSVFETLMTDAMRNKSEAEKADIRSNFDKLKSGSWKGIKFGGLFLAIIAAIPAAVAVGVGSMAAPALTRSR